MCKQISTPVSVCMHVCQREKCVGACIDSVYWEMFDTESQVTRVFVDM